mgnify:CR=1 FL=1
MRGSLRMAQLAETIFKTAYETQDKTMALSDVKTD